MEDESALLARFKAAGPRHDVKVEAFHEPPFTLPHPGNEPLGLRPVVVGWGPAGLAAGYFLAIAGYAPIVLERGRKVRDRIQDVAAFDRGGPLNPESNYLFGEGGAGTFSDGKLTCRGSGEDVRRVLELFAECKGKPSIVYEHRPHLGSNRLPAVVKRSDNASRNLVARSGSIVESKISTAPMGDARPDYFQRLPAHNRCRPGNRSQCPRRLSHAAGAIRAHGPKGLPARRAHRTAARKCQSRSLRIASSRRHSWSGGLFIDRAGQNNLFTFCMCAGGFIIPSVSEPGYFCTNGMSLSRRDSPYANSGLMITIEPDDFGATDLLAGVRLQEQYEQRALHSAAAATLVPSNEPKISWPGVALPSCRLPATHARWWPRKWTKLFPPWWQPRCDTACRS